MNCMANCGRIIFILFFVGISLARAQTQLKWEDFTDISFVTAPGENGYSFMKPIFQDKLIQLNGKLVQITGYMIPLDVEGRQYVISAYPNASCFFCGSAGKESVVEVFLERFDKKYEVDEILTLEGKLELSDREGSLCYKLRNAVEAK